MTRAPLIVITTMMALVLIGFALLFLRVGIGSFLAVMEWIKSFMLMQL
jgi:hypothetical protein